jgi:hypothetical protein
MPLKAIMANLPGGYGVAGKLGTLAAYFAIWCYFCGLRFDLDQTSPIHPHTTLRSIWGVGRLKNSALTKASEIPQQIRKCCLLTSSDFAASIVIFSDKYSMCI